MDSEELTAEAWLARGTEAYTKGSFDKAAEHFEKAIAADPRSAQAHLALGATRLTLYQGGRWPPSPAYGSIPGDILEAEFTAYREQEKALLIEQNSTNWPLAEKSLNRASQLDPQNSLIAEYLCALYWIWEDPLNEENDRMDDAKWWLKRLAEVDPGNKYTDLYCGILLSGKARKLLPNYGCLPSSPEPNPTSLQTKVGPLLEEAMLHLTRALARQSSDQEHAAVLHLVDEITSMQTYLVFPEQAMREMHDRAIELFRKHSQPRAAERQAVGGALPPGPSDTITFTLTPEALAEDRARPFPPNPWRLPQPPMPRW
jgi:tetratricopeptide (TPR) repeat protein